MVELVKWTFGKTWWKHQIAARGDEHVVLRWTRAFAALSHHASPEPTAPDDRPRLVATASGPASALLAFGYDLYCLQARDKLPTFLVSRLGDNKTFQSARYEIAVTGIMARAGFKIVFLDDKVSQAKHCEFVATHTSSGYRVAVEAKSRVRPGVLLERGEFAYEADVKGLSKLLRDASKQTVNNLPLVIFLDVNLPTSIGASTEERAWMRDANAAADDLDRRGARSDGSVARYSLLLFTNFGFHFGSADSPALPVELGIVRPPPPRIDLPRDVLAAIVESTRRYGRVPAEL